MTSLAQRGPVQPAAHEHVNEPAELTHVPLLLHRVEPPTAVHSLTSCVQRSPVQPVVHAHVNDPSVFEHEPLLAHGETGPHSLMSV